jgi:hypothetical protein
MHIRSIGPQPSDSAPRLYPCRYARRLPHHCLTRSVEIDHFPRTMTHQTPNPTLENILTFSYSEATVCIIDPSILFIWVIPFPTTPKFSAEPTASIFGPCGDHFTAVFAIGSFIPTPAGLSILISKYNTSLLSCTNIKKYIP